MYIWTFISNFFWPFSVTFIFVVTFFGHDKKMLYPYVLCIFIALLMIILKVTLKVHRKKKLRTSVILLLHLYRDHVLNPLFLPSSSNIHQINRYFSCSFKKIHKSGKYDLTYNFCVTYSFFSYDLLMQQLVTQACKV